MVERYASGIPGYDDLADQLGLRVKKTEES